MKFYCINLSLVTLQEKCQDDISRGEREFIAKQADLDRQISKAEKTREAELKRLDAELADKLQVRAAARMCVPSLAVM